MARLLDAYLGFDIALRAYLGRLGASEPARRLARAATDLRRDIAVRALNEEAADFDPRTDLARIFAAAEAAGLSWPDMAEALNTYHQRHPEAGR